MRGQGVWTASYILGGSWLGLHMDILGAESLVFSNWKTISIQKECNFSRVARLVNTKNCELSISE